MTPDIRNSRLAARIAARARRAGLHVADPLLQNLAAYVGLLMRWNRRINLTALADDDQGLDRLVVEPLAAVQRLPRPGVSVTDIGSGGGSPAIPMKLAVPAVRLRMVESKTRKAAFLREAARQLGLEQTVVDACRYEDLAARGGAAAESDVVTVRAVRIGSRMLQRIQPLVKAGGAVFLFRTGADVELDVPPPLRVDASCPLPGSPASRLLILRKPADDDAEPPVDRDRAGASRPPHRLT